MQVSVATPHTALAPISEAGGGPNPREPRRSLRNLRPPPPLPEMTQPRRYTTLLNAASAVAAAAAAAASVRSRAPWRRTSSIKSADSLGLGGAAGGRQQPVRQENTYRTGPARPFQLEAAETLLGERLAAFLHSYKYNAHSAKDLTRSLAQDVKNRMKQELSADMQQRFKLVVLVTITEPSAPSGLAAARALWSAETGDACARAEFRTSGVAAFAAVFAFYFE